jgi:hypothetical protein
VCIEEHHRLEIKSAIALGIMAILSALLGRFAAGPVLRPVRTIFGTDRLAAVYAGRFDREAVCAGILGCV